jgi:hypothetical protein
LSGRSAVGEQPASVPDATVTDEHDAFNVDPPTVVELWNSQS